MKIKIELLDKTIKEFEKSLTILEVAKNISPSFAKKVLFAKVNGEVVNNNFLITKDAKVSFVLKDDFNDEKLINLQAIKMISIIFKNNFREYKLINNNADEDYFYLDFDSKEPFKASQLNQLNNKILKYVKNFKVDDTFTITNINYFSNFKLLSTSGIYLENNKNNKMINRITGLAAINSTRLKLKEDEINKRLESDHRIIGNKLKIFMFSDLVGAGLPIWLPNGVILKNEIKRFLQAKEVEYGFSEVESPILGNINMYKASGHLSHYKDDMFSPIKTNNEELMLRPMSCPHHIAIFKNELYSYNDLPIRYSENAFLFRYEKSGALTGLERVRMMELTDSHIFTTMDQLKAEFKNCFKLIMDVLNTFKIKIYYFSLSLRDKKNKEKFYDDNQMWDNSEKILKEVLDELKVNYKTIEGEAAFYGPKLDIQIESVLKHEITISTIQLDMLFAKKFNATYIDKNNKKINPVIIHRGLIGTYERFVSILLEQTKGILPLWLAPKQAIIIPVNNSVLTYCQEVKEKLVKNGVRVSVDNSQERLNYKIRQAQINKIKYQLIIGDNEKDSNSVAIRKYSDTKTENYKLDNFIKLVKKEIVSKS